MGGGGPRSITRTCRTGWVDGHARRLATHEGCWLLGGGAERGTRVAPARPAVTAPAPSGRPSTRARAPPQVGGGKPKMRHYFGLNGWPSSSVLGGRAPADEAEQARLIDALQDWKTDKYKAIIGGRGRVLVGDRLEIEGSRMHPAVGGTPGGALASSDLQTLSLPRRRPAASRARSRRRGRPRSPAPAAPRLPPGRRRQRRGVCAAGRGAADGRGAGGGGARGGLLRGHQERGGVCAGQPAGQGGCRRFPDGLLGGCCEGWQRSAGRPADHRGRGHWM